MREPAEQILRGACCVLAAWLCVAIFKTGCRTFALAGAKIPAAPALSTNSPASADSSAGKTTNAIGIKNPVTNSLATNGIKPSVTLSNAGPGKMTNDISTNNVVTNSFPISTNLANPVLTNVFRTNLPTMRTNQLSLSGTNLNLTNREVKKAKPQLPSGMAMPEGMSFGGMDFGGMPGMPGRAPKLPPEIQARVDKIEQSEMFAPVFHPPPLALLGIAGDTAFLQSPTGQTGLAKTNESVGEVKLLRIGINRVLVELNGEKKELKIFDGYGGENLLPDGDKK